MRIWVESVDLIARFQSNRIFMELIDLFDLVHPWFKFRLFLARFSVLFWTSFSVILKIKANNRIHFVLQLFFSSTRKTHAAAAMMAKVLACLFCIGTGPKKKQQQSTCLIMTLFGLQNLFFLSKLKNNQKIVCKITKKCQTKNNQKNNVFF